MDFRDLVEKNGFYEAVELYTPTVEYPLKPAKPHLLEESPNGYRKYADKLEAYEKELKAFRTQLELYNTKKEEIYKEIKAYVCEESRIPLQYVEKCFELANSEDSQWDKIYEKMMDLSNIFK